MIHRLGLVVTIVGTVTVAAAAHAAPSVGAVVKGFAADSATGCLQKGDKAGSFTLTSKDGKTLDVSSKSMKLDGHVGHTVTLTGDTQTKDSKTWMDAKKLSMVSPSCS